MPNTALITGAFAGIGAEFARYHASKGGDLVIAARRSAPLLGLKDELEAAHGIRSPSWPWMWAAPNRPPRVLRR
ncbi:MAG: SDR family NAD(P)-dependent oxidoreductase [Pseudomonadota bacterium]